MDLDHEWVLPSRPTHSKAGWSPFAGMKVQGILRKVRQEAGGKREEGGRRWETGLRRQETGLRRQETGLRRQETKE